MLTAVARGWPLQIAANEAYCYGLSTGLMNDLIAQVYLPMYLFYNKIWSGKNRTRKRTWERSQTEANPSA